MKKLIDLVISTTSSGNDSSEGRCLGEFVRDILEDDPCNVDLVISSMDEFIEWAQVFRSAAVADRGVKK